MLVEKEGGESEGDGWSAAEEGQRTQNLGGQCLSPVTLGRLGEKREMR